MGCFSSVCIVSKLPIYSHPVVGIPIRKNSPHGGRRRIACYPNADWELDGFPFFGKNDDYGRIEDFQNGAANSASDNTGSLQFCDQLQRLQVLIEDSYFQEALDFVKALIAKQQAGA